MGVFAGFTPMAMALAISLGPRERMGQAIGLVQAAQFLPLAFGPPIGGLISDTFGLRANFVLTGFLLIVPALLLFFLVREDVYDPPKGSPSGKTSAGGAFVALATLPGFAAALGILFLARFNDRVLPAILPLYLIELDTPAPQLATVTGLIVAIGAIAAAISSMLYGRLSNPGTMRRLLILALAGGALCSAPLALVGSWPEVLGLRLLLGLLAGGSMSLAYTLGARLAPAERSGLTLSVLGSCGQLGGAISPMLAGVVGQFSLRAVFLGSSGAYLLALALAATLVSAASRKDRSGPDPEPRDGGAPSVGTPPGGGQATSGAP